MCCDSHQLLSEDQKCVDLAISNPLEELNNYNSEIIATEDPLFKCFQGSKRLYFTTTDKTLNGSIIDPLFNQKILEGSYCVQPSTQMGLNGVLFCRQPVQIRKCCPSGQLINRTSINQCIVNNREDTTQFPMTYHFLDESTVNYDEDDIIVRDNASLQCDFDYNVYIPGYYIDHGFKVNNEFGLYVEKAAYTPIRHSKNYCVDNTVYANGTQGVSFLRERNNQSNL
jgi:hypothetical protein